MFLSTEDRANHDRYIADNLAVLYRYPGSLPFTSALVTAVTDLEGGSNFSQSHGQFDSLRKAAEAKAFIKWVESKQLVEELKKLKETIKFINGNYAMLENEVHLLITVFKEPDFAHQDFFRFLLLRSSYLLRSKGVLRLGKFHSWVIQHFPEFSDWSTLTKVEDFFFFIREKINDWLVIIKDAEDEVTANLRLSEKTQERVNQLLEELIDYPRIK